MIDAVSGASAERQRGREVENGVSKSEFSCESRSEDLVRS